MIENFGVIGISSLAKQILYITGVIFIKKTRNMFSKSIKKVISKCLGHFNSIHIKRYKHKIVIKLILSSFLIFH